MANDTGEQPDTTVVMSQQQQYRLRMFGDWGRCECNNQGKCEKGDACFFKKARAALERAHDIRKFEIELLWKRAAYVATFQTLLFAAMGLSFRAYGDLASLFQIITCVAGVFSSFFWYLINKGSKFWHENWTHHIDFLEDEFEGKLHKTVLYDGDESEQASVSNKILLDAKTSPYSVSRVNIAISILFFTAWSGLLFVLLLGLFDPLSDTTVPDIFGKEWLGSSLFIVSFVVVLGVVILLCNNALKSIFSDADPEKDVRWVRRELPNAINMSSGEEG